MRQGHLGALAFAIAVFLLGFAGTGRADNPETDVCTQTACREGGFDVAVSVDKEHYTTVPVSHSPYVLPDGAILVFPGETLVFELPVADGKTGTAKFVAEYAPTMPVERDPNGPPAPVRDLPKLKGEMPEEILAAFPEGTFIVSYGQLERGAGMCLMLMHNLPHNMKLDAVMSVIKPGKYELHPTSTCPLKPKIFSLEHWPHLIGPMILKNIRILPDGADMRCE